ncbi:MAG: DUF4974 domain-containing protein [Bacteroides sp.]
MTNQDFYTANLIAKHLSGEMTADEKARLEDWRMESQEHEIIFQKIGNKENYRKHLAESSSFDVRIGWEEVSQRIKKNQRRKRMIKWMSYAAAIVLPIALISFFMKQSSTAVLCPEHAMIAQTITPGEAKAILTLDNGKTIQINKSVNHIGHNLVGTQIAVDSVALKYQSVPNAVKKQKLVYNKIEIPRGGEYALILSDGTKVHLNSMSSLRFPVSFGKGRREVELVGEAFFEVNKSKQPFIVHTKEVQVEVLGTIFNICAYPDEEYQATLVSGSVKVKAGKGEGCLLKPSQQASVTPGMNHIKIRSVDAAFYTSWVKGKINFKDKRLEEIMKTLSRWYDMKVIYADESVKNIRFGCNVDRYEEIIPFVRLLEKTGRVKIKINGKTITFYN